MKYLVISDTHGYISSAVDLIENLKPDYCIHLGDMVSDCEELEYIFPKQKFIFVKGNNDFWTRNNLFPDEKFFNLEGKNFFLTHGHKYHVKGGLELLKKTASEKNADIVLYGHTHVKNLVWDNNTLILNPGSRTSYGIIEIKDGKVSAELCDDE